jgi:hypothetical protein
MDSITRFLRSNQLKFAKMSLLRFITSLILVGFAIHASHAAGPEGQPASSISAMQVERVDGAIHLNSQVKFELPTAVEDVLFKGIPLIFVAEVEVRRDRWYWYDKKVVVANREMRLAYQPLTRRWRLNITNGYGATGSGTGLGGGLPQYFDTLSEALSKVQRISRWRIVELSELDPDTLLTLELNFKLDVSQLPRPFQIGLIGQNDWNISASKSIRFASEVIK